MKKIFLLLFCFASTMLAACSPQVAVISEVTVTLPPTATQTSEPSATPTAVYTPTPAREIITIPSGFGFELGAQIEGQPEGVREVVDIVPPDVWDDEKTADYEERIDPTTYGFGEGETRLVYIPTEDGKGRVELQRTSNPADVIAVFEHTGFTWNPELLVGDNGDPIALLSGKTVDMKGGAPVNAATDNSALTRLTNEMSILFPYLPAYTRSYGIFTSKDGENGVPFGFAQTNKEGTEGYFYFRAADNKTIISMYITGYDGTLNFAKAWRWR